MSSFFNEPKIILGLLIYFIALTSIVTIASGVSVHYGLDDQYTIDGGSLAFRNLETGFAGDPRFADIQFSGLGLNYNFLKRFDTTPQPLLQAGFITDADTCERYAGFSWVEETYLFFFGTGTFTCTGELDTTVYDPSGTWQGPTLLSGKMSKDPICDLPLLSTDKQLALSFGCTWYEAGAFSPMDFDVTSGRQGVVLIWGTIKDIFTLNVDFGITDTFLKVLVNFFVFILPLLLLIIIIVQYVRRFVGFT